MWHYLKFSIDDRPLCVVTRPIVWLVIASAIAGVCGILSGVAYGAFRDSFHFAIEFGLRLAGAGAVAGFVMGLWSGLDRLNWPEEEWGGPSKPRRLLPLVKVNSQSSRQLMSTKLIDSKLPDMVSRNGC
jgi:hypothetical protein